MEAFDYYGQLIIPRAMRIDAKKLFVTFSDASTESLINRPPIFCTDSLFSDSKIFETSRKRYTRAFFPVNLRFLDGMTQKLSSEKTRLSVPS